MPATPKKPSPDPAHQAANAKRITDAMEFLPTGLFLMSGQHDTRRAGTPIRWAVQCSADPVLICVSLRKGHWVSPLVRDSHCFGLSVISDQDKLILRKFGDQPRGKDGDPFDCLAIERLVSCVPLLARSPMVLDCEVVRHLDLESDHELFIGRVLAARVTRALHHSPDTGLANITGLPNIIGLPPDTDLPPDTGLPSANGSPDPHVI